MEASQPCLGELATAARHSLPITALVFNDAALSLIDVKQQQRGFKANEVRYPGINFADIAEGANWRSYRVNNPRELQMSLKKAMKGTTPALIDVTVDAAGYRAQLEAVRDAPIFAPNNSKEKHWYIGLQSRFFSRFIRFKVGDTAMVERFPVLLAGGLGTRLWPLSREIYPKQLMSISGKGSLLQQAAGRAIKIAPPEQVITVTTEAHYRPIRDQLVDVDPALGENILIEPEGRNTAAAIAISAFYAEDRANDAVLLVTPADHAIEDEATVSQAFEGAIYVASLNRLVTFGIRPTRAETDFGYIRQGQKIEATEGAFEVKSFIEKPDHMSAERMIADTDVYWNSGMFVFSANTILHEINRFEPEIFATSRNAFEQRVIEKNITRFTSKDYAKIPSLPIDKAVMERSNKVALIPIDLGWSDVGSWQKLWEISPRDENGVAVTGDVMVEGCRDSLLRSEGRLLACVGLENLAVVETADAVLVANKNSDQGIREIVKRLSALRRPEATRHLNEKRPWGSFKVLMENPGFKIKELVINVGGRLSLQSHQHRTEHWVVVSGKARVTRGDEVEFLSSNQSTYIPANVRHRLENAGPNVLRVIEVQCGNYLGEDDIERHDDVHGRVTNDIN